jgi:hypothetical protein
MPIEALPLDAEVSVLVDWFELATLSSANHATNLAEVKNQIEMQRDTQEENWSEEDEFVEDLQTKISSKVAQRRKALGENYPFTISDDGKQFVVREQLGTGGTIYVFCLIVSQAIDSHLVTGSLVPQLTNQDRDLFQVCATLCAAGSCAGPAISFGWPRQDRTTIIEKLKQIEVDLHSQVRNEPLPGVSPQVKDDEIDVIAWRRENDGLQPTLYLLGQAASGRGWKDKSPRNAIDNFFHQTWFSVQPPMQAMAALFIPFAPDENEAPFEGYDEAAPGAGGAGGVAYLQGLKLGTIYSRYRLPYYAALASNLLANGVAPIERIGDLPALEQYVAEYRALLEQEAA